MLTYVIPAHNSAAIIRETLETLRVSLAEVASEIVVVENGSTDDTWEVLLEARRGWPEASQVQLRLDRSEKGMGRALRRGIARSRGRVVVLTADDLPFGFDDIDAYSRLDPAPVVLVGSKAHRESEATRGAARWVLSTGFRALRRASIGMRTGDPQGTFVLNGAWVRSLEPALTEGGFLLTTEIAFAAELGGVNVVEVPVRLRDTHGEHATRVRVKDIEDMGRGLLRLRRRRRVLAAAANQALYTRGLLDGA